MACKCELCGDCDDKKKKVTKVFFCPRCKSLDVYHPFKIGNLFGLISQWECGNCKFKALVFPQGELKQKTKKKGAKKR